MCALPQKDWWYDTHEGLSSGFCPYCSINISFFFDDAEDDDNDCSCSSEGQALLCQTQHFLLHAVGTPILCLWLHFLAWAQAYNAQTHETLKIHTFSLSPEMRDPNLVGQRLRALGAGLWDKLPAKCILKIMAIQQGCWQTDSEVSMERQETQNSQHNI